MGSIIKEFQKHMEETGECPCPARKELEQQLTKQGDYLKLVEADRDAFRKQLAEAKAEKEKLKADYKCLEWEYQGR